MFDYVIGIDGGGTKTLGALYSIDGLEIKRVQLGFSNFSVDEVKAKNTLIELIETLLKDLDVSKKVFIQMGIAGASRLSNKESFIDYLESKFNCKVDLDTDALIALYSVDKRKGEIPILAIGGTGSIVMIEKAQIVERIGGWGHLLGDEGSAYHLVITAIKNIISEYELGQGLGVLSEHLLKKMDLDDPKGIIDYVYNKPKSELALLSSEIQQIAKTDSLAKSLLINEAKMLSGQIITAYKRFINDENIVIALKGSFALKALYVKETILEDLKKHLPNARIDEAGYEPVYGAYRLAKNKVYKE
ncbi:MAG: BadF/BadG/BcrA/BcrD ATPase family protein [Acholeplasmataceae bacterium]|nr:BadF/BadG/BcrA/BcrD ATPase family protein [Acholeplasmataceae bacterium]